MAYSFEGVSAHPERNLCIKHFTTRCYSDSELCRFLDICDDKHISVSHVIAIEDGVSLVVYKWTKYVNVRGDNIE